MKRLSNRGPASHPSGGASERAPARCAMSADHVDVHQHVWPEVFLDALRARRRPPRLAGWTLFLHGERPYAVDPRAHDPGRRAEQAADDGLDRVLVAASAALGLAELPPEEAADLAAAWHDGALALPDPFRPWATAGVLEPDPVALEDALSAGCVGLEVPANVLGTPAAVERLGELLVTLEHRGAPLLVHPGPRRAGPAPDAPAWWVPVVDYVAQLHAAWWAWRAAGSSAFPDLQVCFCALAGLGPLHDERHRARGGEDRPVDRRMFLETSSYGPRAVDATIRVLGVDVVCHGSDRPYAAPIDLAMGEPVDHALRVANPAHLLATVVRSRHP